MGQVAVLKLGREKYPFESEVGERVRQQLLSPSEMLETSESSEGESLAELPSISVSSAQESQMEQDQDSSLVSDCKSGDSSTGEFLHGRLLGEYCRRGDFEELGLQWKLDEAKKIIRNLLIEGRKLTIRLAEREELLRNILEDNKLALNLPPCIIESFGAKVKTEISEFRELL